MCRMFMLSSNEPHVFPALFRSLQEASRLDPFPDPEENGAFHTHGDGWGLASISESDQIYSRSIGPVYEARIPGVTEGVTMVHSRKTSSDQPGGVVNNHPFHAVSGNKDFFLCHNGWFDKFTLPFDNSFDVTSITDSEALLRYLTQDGDTNPEWKLEHLSHDGVRFALANVFLISVEKIPGEKPDVNAIYFSEKGDAGKTFEEFDRLYFIQGEDWKAVISSSLLKSEQFPGFKSKSEVQRGRAFSL